MSQLDTFLLIVLVLIYLTPVVLARVTKDREYDQQRKETLSKLRKKSWLYRLPAAVIYVGNNSKLVGKNYAGVSRGPIIFIKKNRERNLSVYAHERVHAMQFYRSFGMLGLQVLFSKRKRYETELEAYIVHINMRLDYETELHGYTDIQRGIVAQQLVLSFARILFRSYNIPKSISLEEICRDLEKEILKI